MKLDQKLEGNTYILLAETSTGQEQHRYAVSDSLARALKTGGKCEPNVENGVFIPFVGDYKLQVAGICDEGHKVLSFTDFSNKLNEKDLITGTTTYCSRCTRRGQRKQIVENG